MWTSPQASGIDAQLHGQLQQLRQPRGVIAFAVQVHGQPGALHEHLLQPARLSGIGLRTWHPQREQAQRLARHPAQHPLHILPGKPVTALACRTPPGGDQFAQAHVAALVFHQQHQFQPALQHELAADDQRHAGGARCFQPAHDAGQRALIGDRQGLVAALMRTGEQFLGAGRTAQERKIGQAVQLGIRRQRIFVRDIVVGRRQPFAGFPRTRHALARGIVTFFDAAHANQPCSIQSPCWPGRAKAQACWPCDVSST
ncbi:hypothetical protein QE373_000480 [Stenotrophomonas sp. SORGH_AS321]|nr:hypothetical protein [Stenotrophomonas sp. SORGH_AS_0321]